MVSSSGRWWAFRVRDEWAHPPSTARSFFPETSLPLPSAHARFLLLPPRWLLDVDTHVRETVHHGARHLSSRTLQMSAFLPVLGLSHCPIYATCLSPTISIKAPGTGLPPSSPWSHHASIRFLYSELVCSLNLLISPPKRWETFRSVLHPLPNMCVFL